MARPALCIEVTTKDQNALRKLLSGGYSMRRSGPARLRCWDSQRQRIIAMICSDPPKGRARWSVRLVAEEAVKRRLVPQVGRETVRVLLLHHDLKPWRETNVVVRRHRPAGSRG